MKRRQYTEELKREAVRLALEPGQTKAQVACDLGLSESVLFRWVSRLAAASNQQEGCIQRCFAGADPAGVFRGARELWHSPSSRSIEGGGQWPIPQLRGASDTSRGSWRQCEEASC